MSAIAKTTRAELSALIENAGFEAVARATA